MVRPDRIKPLYTLFYNKDATFMKHLRTFGEMAVVAIHEREMMRSKLDNIGKTCMFVGYAEDHSGDVYRFLNIHTKRIIMSRDARWLNIIWKHYRMKSIYARKQVELFLDKCLWIHYLFLWNPNCLEKQRDEKCGTVNY